MSLSLMANKNQDPCKGLNCHQGPGFSCKSEDNKNKHRIVIVGTAGRGDNVTAVSDYVTEKLGWCGIGAHYFVEANGDIYRCRPLDQLAAVEKTVNFDGTVIQGNREAVGIQVAVPQDQSELSIKFQTNLVKLMRNIMGVFDIPVSRFSVHFDGFHQPAPIVRLFLREVFGSEGDL